MAKIEMHRCDNPSCGVLSSTPVEDNWIHFRCSAGSELLKGAERVPILTNLEDKEYCSTNCFIASLGVPSSQPLKPEEGVKKMRTTTRWSEEKLVVLRQSPGPADAVKAYREKFPNSVKTDSSIKSKFYQLHKLDTKNDLGPSPDKEKQGGPDPIPATTGELETLEGPEIPKVSKDARGNVLFVGAKVRQVAGKSRANGIGSVKAISNVDGLVNVQFMISKKVLPADHFELYEPMKKDADVVAALEEGS